jgi:two-component system chemotaxis response regulator CheY
VVAFSDVMNALVLIVDDSGFARSTLRQTFEGAGHSVEEARDGYEALERYAVRRPDVVFLDLVMEQITGLEVLEKLRAMDKEAKIVVATADVQTSTCDRARAAGASGYILKPFDQKQVLETVTKVLSEGNAWN